MFRYILIERNNYKYLGMFKNIDDVDKAITAFITDGKVRDDFMILDTYVGIEVYMV